MDQAFSLERLVMRGDVDAGYLQAIGVSSPDAVVSDLEDNLRALLRDMVCGHLALDLTGIADDLLRTPTSGTAEIEVEAPPEPPPEPEFVVRRADPVADAAPHFEEPDPDAEEQDTDEAVAIGLDDDAGDYSAAV